MALELCLISEETGPLKRVEMGVNLHYSLMQALASINGYPLLKRMADYYEDAEFAADEVDSLFREANQALHLPDLENTAIRAVLEEICALTHAALTANKGLSALAD